MDVHKIDSAEDLFKMLMQEPPTKEQIREGIIEQVTSSVQDKSPSLIKTKIMEAAVLYLITIQAKRTGNEDEFISHLGHGIKMTVTNVMEQFTKMNLKSFSLPEVVADLTKNGFSEEDITSLRDECATIMGSHHQDMITDSIADFRACLNSTTPLNG